MTSDQQPTPSVEEAEAWNRYELAVESIERGPSRDTDADWSALVQESEDAQKVLRAVVRAPLEARIAELMASRWTDYEQRVIERDDWKRRAEAAELELERLRNAVE